MPRNFILPDLGEGITEAQIIRVLVKPGERVAEDQALMEVETDKAAVEIPSPYAGIATTVHVKEGQTVNVGDVVVSFDDGAATPAPPAKSAPAKASAAVSTTAARSAGSQAPPAPSRTAVTMTEAPPAHLSPVGRVTTAPAAPAVRKVARELGIDLDTVPGTGPGGRVTREDVEEFAKRGPGAGKATPAPTGRPAAPAAPLSPTKARPPAGPPPGIADADKWGPIRREPLTQIRKTIANQMSRSAFTAVHVTHGDFADITELERVRKHLNQLTDNDPKLTVMTFVIRATCLALRKHPVFNASFDDEGGQIIYKDYVNLGIAVDTERGLIVPVIRNADTLGLRGIAAALRSIADRIRANQFAIEDLRGGTFTITNVGALGGTFSTPIINFPEVAILGLGRSKWTPIVKDEKIVPALMMPINLSFDHRATDGANAARFCGDLLSYLENPTKMLLD